MAAHPPYDDPARSRPTAPGDPADDGMRTVDGLFRILADGNYHRVGDLAGVVADAPDRVLRHIATLAGFGMAIATERDAFRTAPYVVLDAPSIERRLRAAKRPPDASPWRASVVFATDSTNDDMLAEVRGDPPFHGPSLRAAETQRKGRGRLGRSWVSAPGASLTASFALQIRRPLAALDGVTLACGLAVLDVLATQGTTPRLKWPNDILVGNRKLAGILVEAHAIRGGTVLVIGVGINVAAIAPGASSDASLPLAGTALLQEAGMPPIDRNDLTARLALSLEAQMTLFATAGFGAFADRWNAVDAYRDLPVTLSSIWDPDLTGIARGVDDHGALLLDAEGGRRRIIAGDVSLRLAPSPVALAAT